MARPMDVQRVSSRGRDFIVRREGVKRYAYNDSSNYATFGVGHLIGKRPVNDRDRRKWGTPENPKPMRLVYKILDQDLVQFEDAVLSAVGRRMMQRRFDACVSLAFNIGAEAFKDSTLARILREKKPGYVQAAADEFLKWKRSGNDPDVLLPRRRLERKLFLDGKYQ